MLDEKIDIELIKTRLLIRIKEVCKHDCWWPTYMKIIGVLFPPMSIMLGILPNYYDR